MALIIAARFDTFEQAEAAAQALMNHGVTSDDLHTFFVNPAGWHDNYPLGGDRAADPNSKGAPVTAIAGAALLGLVGAVIGGGLGWLFSSSSLLVVGGIAVGAYVGSLAGAMHSLGKSRPQQGFAAARRKVTEGRRSGVLLAVHTTPEKQNDIATLLRNAGGKEVERAHGRWNQGRWEDFDPLRSPHPQ
ncbi:MAG TPA: hypothetical protein VL003_06925 [Pusillimonas sp.]|uniref:hypothetical protein n=1 Tax=Pusillimonas sp. TaxID=3040095 RepID=UPI002BB228C0|nr:hypothetical protein [Pusillimonas sp.]HUH87771.1 hypothetical protein [Pusillimonas sp.]